MDFSESYQSLKNRVENSDKLTPEELKQLLVDLKNCKTEYNNLQLVVKRNGNSLYGVSASIYFSLCDVDVAEDITTTCKHFAVTVDIAINTFFVNWDEAELKIIQEFYPDVISLRKFTEYKRDTENDLCVYGDTDSRYIDLSKIYSFLITENGPKEIPKPGKEGDNELSDFGVFLNEKFIANIIKDSIELECDYRNAKKGYLKMAMEKVCRKSTFLKKKKYILTTIWKDGKKLDSPKLNYTGVELKKGGSSPRAKKILGKLTEKFLLDNISIEDLRLDIINIYKFIKQSKQKDIIYQISSVSGLKNIQKVNNIYTSDKNHIQMQIVLSWLNFIEKNNYQGIYKAPFEGQKMNYYYCDEASGYKVIGVPDDIDMTTIKNLPEPDWNRMINATIIKPLLRYIVDKEEIDDIDCNNFLIGIKNLRKI